METITSDKSWDKIKDLLWLKLCNANIHTYNSCFMEIQQQPKESLAAYIHQLKMEAKRFNFINDTTTIRIFIKGLKNAHSLATCTYEKGPQMLTDAILEVERLNVIQQLTAMIIPPSMVNVIWHEDDCFKHHKQGHITWNCPHIRCYKLDQYGILSWIVHTRYLLQESQWFITIFLKVTMQDQVQDITMKTETGKANPDCNLIFKDNVTWVIKIHTEAAQGHNTGINAATTGAAHNDHTPPIEAAATNLTVTYHIDHIAHHPHIEVLQLTNPEIAVVDHTHNHPTDLQGKTCTYHVHIPADHEEENTSRKTQGW